LQRAAAGEQDYTQINPYAFTAAIAPQLAAQLQGERIDLERIVACARTLQEPGGQLIVEGIGGWQVPLQATTTVMDLAVKLQLPVILVVGMRLGCLNHALLTVESILSSGLVLYGWVANELVPEMQQLQANIDCLQERIEAPLLARIPWQSQPEQPRIVWFQQPDSYSRTAS